MIRLLRLVVLVPVLATAGAPLHAAGSVWQPVAEEIVDHIDRAETAYRDGRAKDARRAVVRAYFGIFESKKMEAALRKQIGAKHAYLVERHFGNLRKGIKAGRPAAEIADLAEKIRAAVRRDARVLDAAGVPAEVYQVTR